MYGTFTLAADGHPVDVLQSIAHSLGLTIGLWYRLKGGAWRAPVVSTENGFSRGNVSYQVCSDHGTPAYRVKVNVSI